MSEVGVDVVGHRIIRGCLVRGVTLTRSGQGIRHFQDLLFAPPPLRCPVRTHPALAAYPPARGVGHRGPAVDTPRRRRPDPPAINLPLAMRTVGRYLRRWGFTAKRLRRHARDQDPEEVRQGWKRFTRPLNNGPRRKKRKSTGATRSAWRQTNTRRLATHPRESQRRWTCRTRTSAPIRYRPSATTARSIS
jgi:hypothetical protein